MKYDLVVIGGGAAGITSAIFFKKKNPDKKVLILERSFSLGRKILVSGAGRCNITNINLDKYKFHFYGTSENFLMGVFEPYGLDKIKDFFTDLGIELYIERKTNIGKIFPTINQAKAVLEILVDELNLLGVDILLNSEVIDLKKEFGTFNIKFIKEGNESLISSKSVVVSAGGKTYPALGSNGSMYSILEKLGHKIIKPVPSALPLVTENKLCHLLQGVKVDAKVTSIIDGVKVKSSNEELLFTQYGVSGPSVLNISREISIELNRGGNNNIEIEVDFLPEVLDISSNFKIRWGKRPNQTLEKSLVPLLGIKIPKVLIEIININPNKKVIDLTDIEKSKLFNILKSYRMKIKGTRGWNEAEFTAGGIDTNEIVEATLESKILPNLYFCGEIVNVDGDVGGYNLSWAWSSGMAVGENINAF